MEVTIKHESPPSLLHPLAGHRRDAGLRVFWGVEGDEEASVEMSLQRKAPFFRLEGHEMGEQSYGDGDRIVISRATLITAGLATIIVPPSSQKPNLTELEQGFGKSAVWLLVTAVVAAWYGHRLAKSGRLRMVCVLALLSVMCINAAGYLSSAYGIEGGNLLMTLVMTSPAIWLIVRRTLGRGERRSLHDPKSPRIDRSHPRFANTDKNV